MPKSYYFTSLLLSLSLVLGFAKRGRADVARVCIDAYGAGLPRPAPIARFEDRIAFLEERVRGNRSFDGIIGAFNTQKVRRRLVEFQALFKVYEQIPASEMSLAAIEEGRRDLKVLEDVIGDLQRNEEITKRAQRANLSPEILTQLDADMQALYIGVIGRLRDGGWLPYPLQHLRSLREKIQNYEFRKKKKDQRRQYDGFVKLVKDYRKDLARREHYFAGKISGENKLDGGIHEVRRALRWVLAILQASDGLYHYRVDSRTAAETRRLEAQYGDDRFLNLAPAMKGAIEIERRDALLLSKFVQEFGEIKNFKEGQLDLFDFLTKHGLAAKDEAMQIATRTMENKYGPIDIEKRARALYEEYLERDPLASIIEAVERALARESSESRF